MFEAKAPRESEVISRRLVMPDEINPNQTLFGGVLMSWIDMAAYMCAERHAGTSRVVTASIDRLDFLFPLRIGDHAVIHAVMEAVGRTSMTICVRVHKEDPQTLSEKMVAITYLTFVALDREGVPSPVVPLAASNETERWIQSEAALRSRLISRFRKWWADRQARAA